MDFDKIVRDQVNGWRVLHGMEPLDTVCVSGSPKEPLTYDDRRQDSGAGRNVISPTQSMRGGEL